MSQININHLTFAYDGSYDNVFENVTFQIDTSWKLGFTGRNGRGKTTFLNLLSGKYEYSGNISASVNFEYFPYPVADRTADTVDVVGSICPDVAHWELIREFSLLSLPEDILTRPYDTLSNGEQTKVLLAALFLKENSFLLVDEPTNHLDLAARELVSQYLKSKSGFIVVSHDRVFLDHCIDHILSINKTDIEIQKGNFSSWWLNKERRDQYEFAENEKLVRDIKRLKESARQSDQWADQAEKTKRGKGSLGIEKTKDTMAYYGEKSRRMQQRRKNLEKRQQSAIDQKTELLKNVETAGSLKLSQLVYFANRLVSFEDISLRYGDKTVCEHIHFVIDQGDRIALHGKNGSGKSSIIKLICGEDIAYSGRLLIGSRLQISYVSQDTSDLQGSLSDYARAWQIDESLLKAILRKLDFSRIQFEKDIRSYSGGQKKKVLIARSLCEKAHLHIWDEPLNFIDVVSRMQIEDLLLEYQPTILFVEHDRAFCDRIATKEILL